jgi:hypothetical protein
MFQTFIMIFQSLELQNLRIVNIVLGTLYYECTHVIYFSKSCQKTMIMDNIFITPKQNMSLH